MIQSVDSSSRSQRLFPQFGKRPRSQHRFNIAQQLASLHRIRAAQGLRKKSLDLDLQQRSTQVLRNVERLPQHFGSFFVAILRQVILAQRAPHIGAL